LHRRLIDPDKVVERPDLPAMRVAGDLEVDPGVRGLQDLFGLVGDE
jgi:hypothetical protein